MRLADRVSALEKAVAEIPPTVIHDDEIVEVFAELGGDGLYVLPHHVEALYLEIEPALRSAVWAGARALQFCRTRGIQRPAPVGVVEMTATFVSFSWASEVPDPENLRSWLTQEPRPAKASAGLLKESYDSVHEVREALLFLLFKRYGRKGLWDMSDSEVPLLTEDESSRLLRLIKPIQTVSDPDLPLLLWRDEKRTVRTSWPEEMGQMLTAVDMGMQRPGYLLLARPESGQGAGRSIVLQRQVLEVPPQQVSDDEVVNALSSGSGRFVRPLVEHIDYVYLAIEPMLRASVLMGAEALRLCRIRGVDRPHPVTAVDQAATLVSYDYTSEMPDDLAEICGWASPDSEYYDYGGSRLHTAVSTVGTVRGALIFRLFERHGVGNLRQQTFTDAELTTLTETESKRLLKLIAPLQWEPDPDLPLLAWKDERGCYRTSWSEESGQRWTEVDTGLAVPEYLPLAASDSVEVPEKGELRFSANHYAP